MNRVSSETTPKEKELLAVTLSSIADGVIAADTDGIVLLVNPVAGQLTGWLPAEAIGRPLDEVFHAVHERTGEPLADPLARVLESNSASHPTRARLIARTGHERYVADSVAPIRGEDGAVRGVVVVVRDVTEHRRMEDALITAQKLETVRLLAAGIAHDFNNLLTAIVGNLSLARRLAGRGESFEERLSDSEKALRRAKDLTQQLLTFSAGGAPVRRPLDLAPVVEEAVRFALRGSNVNFRCDVTRDLWTVIADEGQVAQVVQNLAINAAQAVPDGGTIRVRAANREVVAGTQPSPGKYVEVSVIDEGRGIPPEDLRRVFEPFFTTKPQGSGLGLAVCFSIVNRHDGYIAIESKEGVGTTVRFLLPATDERAGEDEPPRSSRPGSGRVLVMDDDAMIRNASMAMLGELGYDVVCTADGDEAVREYESAKKEGLPFDVVLLDLTVPGGTGGLEAMARLRSVDPGVRAIVASGYSTAPVMDRVHEYGFRASLAKPFGIDELGAVVERVLAETEEVET